MKWGLTGILAAVLAGGLSAGEMGQQFAASVEKNKALQSPYANDLGPDALPAEALQAYPDDIRKGYDLTRMKCAKCHSAARPLNSEFTDPDVWQRYVKRMMAKPGCDILSAEGKQIWKFLVHDSKTRKLGANEAKWAAHRKRLMAEFRQKYPARYHDLYEKN